MFFNTTEAKTLPVTSWALPSVPLEMSTMDGQRLLPILGAQKLTYKACIS